MNKSIVRLSSKIIGPTILVGRQVRWTWIIGCHDKLKGNLVDKEHRGTLDHLAELALINIDSE